MNNDGIEKELIRAGVQATIRRMYNGLHSEDDHGYDLYKWLQTKEDEIVEEVAGKIHVGRAMLVD